MDVVEDIRSEAEAWLNFAIDYGLQIVGAVCILIVGWIVAGWLYRRIKRRMLASPNFDNTMAPVAAAVVRYAILVFVLVAVLAQFGVQTTSLIAALGAAGLAIGLALQGTLSNIASGVMLLFLKPVNAGDYIDASGISGTVDEIGLFATKLRTFDGVYLFAPNNKIWNAEILNYSRLPTRRMDVSVGVAYSDDVDGAMKVLSGILSGDDRVLGDPEPQVMVTELADSAVVLNMRCWSKREDYWSLLFDLNRAALVELEAAGYSIPFPQRDVHVITPGATEAIADKTQ
ncbi:MAG: mechanosensitive ion channel domain-containing protein [Pseudomonadota bacterium]